MGGFKSQHMSVNLAFSSSARITASLTRVLPDIGPAVVDALVREFHGQLRGNKSQHYIDNRVKTVGPCTVCVVCVRAYACWGRVDSSVKALVDF